MQSVPTRTVLQTLQSAWRDSSLGQPRLLLLEGAPGLGKSHTLRAFTERTSSQAALRLNLPASGWLAGVLRICRASLEQGRDPGFLEAARRVAPDLRWAQVAQRPSLADQTALWNAVAHALERLARLAGGLILLLEDAHETTVDDLGALRALYRRVLLSKAPVMIVLATRLSEQDLLEGFTQDAAIVPGSKPERVAVSGLDELGVTDLVREELHLEFPPFGLTAWLFERAEGHPLHTLELLRYLCDGQALRQV